MTSETIPTKTAILEAAWARLVNHGPTALKLGRVARDAGVSRQAVYLHFESRGAVLLELVAYIDQKLGLSEQVGAPATDDPVEDVCSLLRVTARHAPKVQEVALAFQLNRHADPDIRAAYEDRMAQRRSDLRRRIEAVHAAGRLRESVDQVVDAMWAVGVPTFYQAVAVDRGWSVGQYEQFVVDMFTRMFVRD